MTVAVSHLGVVNEKKQMLLFFALSRSRRPQGCGRTQSPTGEWQERTARTPPVVVVRRSSAAYVPRGRWLLPSCACTWHPHSRAQRTSLRLRPAARASRRVPAYSPGGRCDCGEENRGGSKRVRCGPSPSRISDKWRRSSAWSSCRCAWRSRSAGSRGG